MFLEIYINIHIDMLMYRDRDIDVADLVTCILYCTLQIYICTYIEIVKMMIEIVKLMWWTW